MKEKVAFKRMYIYLLSVLFLVLAAFTTVMVTYARYQRKTDNQLEFVVGDAASFNIQSDEYWIETEDGTRELVFSVTNDSDSKDSYYILQVLATQGLNPEESEVSIVVKKSGGVEREYVGTAIEIAKDTVLYEEMGPGNEYKFYDSEGKELTWSLDGGKFSECEFTLRISSVTEPCLIELLVSQTDVE